MTKFDTRQTDRICFQQESEASGKFRIGSTDRNFENDFAIIKSLQKAIYGNVLLCKHKSKGVLRAVKVLKKTLIRNKYSSDNLPVFESAEREFEVLRKMRLSPHPNVLCLAPEDEQYESQKHVYVTMPFCEGGELFTKCSQGLLDTEKALKMFLKIMKGVHHLHNCGYVHNDVSLENILLRHEVKENGEFGELGEPVLCDFGLCSRVGEISIKKGKVQYQAPEVIFGDVLRSAASVQSDVYSLGVVLFILMFKYPPYDMPHPKDSRYAHIQAGKMKELLDLWKVSHLASNEIIDLLQAMLREDPEDRPSLQSILALPMFCASTASKHFLEETDMEIEMDNILFDQDDSVELEAEYADDMPNVVVNTPKNAKKTENLLGKSPDSIFGINFMQNRISM